MGLCSAKEQVAASAPVPMTPRDLVAAARRLPEDVDRSKGLRTVHDPSLIAKPKANFRKVLRLGAGESGKSTFFKQMVNIFGEGYNEDDRRAFIQAVHSNLIEGMQVLLANSRRFSRDHPTLYEVSPDLQSDVDIVIKADDQAPLSDELSNAIKVLWTDPGVRQTYRRRNRFQCPDSAHYFFRRLSETDLVSDDYVPTEEDVLRARVRSTGIKQTRILLNQQKVELVDVGGQKNERKKWMHCFENVDTLLFLVAISEYDQVMWEDHTKNRMHDALDLFAQIVNSRWFSKTNVCLVFNKTDMFAAKVKEHTDDGADRFPIVDAFPDFGERNSVGRGLEFFKRKFLKMNRSGPRVHVFTTTATEKDSIFDFFAHLGQIIADTPPLWKRVSSSRTPSARSSQQHSSSHNHPQHNHHQQQQQQQQAHHHAPPAGAHHRRGGHGSNGHGSGSRGSRGGGGGGGGHSARREAARLPQGGPVPPSSDVVAPAGAARVPRSSPRHAEPALPGRDPSGGTHGRSGASSAQHSRNGSRGASRRASLEYGHAAGAELSL